MSILGGVKTGLVTGLLTGLGNVLRASAGVSTLYSIDFSSGPVAQTFPTTAAGLASALGDANATPSYIWLCDEASGNLVDQIASEPLVPANSPLQGQSATGLPSSKKACEVQEGSTNYFESSDTTLCELPGGADGAWLVVFRHSGKTLVNQFVVGKCDFFSEGHYLTNRGPSGNGSMKFIVEDTAGAGVQALNSVTVDDGAWHCAIGVYDDSAQEIQLIVDGVAGAAVSTSGTNGDFTTPDGVRIGNVVSTGYSSPGMQVAYLAWFDGATACDALTAAAMDNFWVHGTDPTGKLSTISRASAIGHWSESGEVAFHAEETTPVVYDPALSSGYGLLTNKATTNLVPYAQLSTGATETNISSTDFSANSPDGMRNATLLTADANGGFQEKVCVTSVSTQYTASVWIKESTVGVTGVLELYDLTTGQSIATQAFTADSTWTQRIEVTGTTDGSCVSAGVRVKIDTSGQSVLVYGCQLELGDSASHYIRTDGAAAATVSSDYRSDSWVQDNASGEIKSTWVRHSHDPTGGGATQYLYDTRPNPGTGNWRRLYQSTAARANAQIRDAVGAIEDTTIADVIVNDTEMVFRQIWDESASGDITGGYEQVMVFNGTAYNGPASPWDGTTGGGDDPTIIYIGNVAGSFPFQGVIQSIVSYDGLSEDIP